MVKYLQNDGKIPVARTAEIRGQTRSKPEIFYLKNRNCKGDKFEMKIRKAEKKDIPSS